MGASFHSRVYPGHLNSGQLQGRVMQDVQDDAIRDGVEYPGTWGQKASGVRILDAIFTNENEAYDFLATEYPDKWDDHVYAVQVSTDKTIDADVLTYPRQKALDDARAACQQDSIQAFNDKIIERIRTAKSRFKLCRQCGSSIARQQVRKAQCPVCDDDHFIHSNTDLVTLKRKKAQYQKKLKRVTSLAIDRQNWMERKSKHLTWVVGGWCSS